MRIAQILLPGASAYDRKCQRVDRAALAASHEVIAASVAEAAASGAQVAHVYGPPSPADFVRFPIPYVATAPLPSRSLWSAGLSARRLFRRPVPPGAVVSPVGDAPLPEAVEEHWFGAGHRPVTRDAKVIASFARDAVRPLVDKTLSRIGRFRSDVTWHLYEKEPAPEDLAGVDAWIDPAAGETDFDGFVAEALVLGLPVVAVRTPLNAWRLENGRTGFLVPPDDPNEMTHAILAALFKVEVAESRQLAAKQTASKFRPRQRLRMLTRLYEQQIS
ncbi:MAG TPA: glycosyltransferase [Thermoanaerobaculia bacterium]|jgi:hypothetical protein